MNRAQILVRNPQFVNQTDVLLSFATGSWMDHKVVLGYRHYAGVRAISCATISRFRRPPPSRRPTFSTLIRGAWAASRWRRPQGRSPKACAGLRRLHRGPDQDHQVVRTARQRPPRQLLDFDQDAPAAVTAAFNISNVSDPRLPSWRVGAVVHPTEKTSIYVMRGTSFNPSADNLSISVTNLQTALSLISLQPEEYADDRDRRKGRGTQRQDDAADRRLQHCEDQPARSRPGQQQRDHPRWRRDGARLGGKRGGLS